MPSPSAERIQEAVRDCLARCRTHETPLICIAEFLDEKRSNPVWTDAELTQVQITVSRVLSRLHGGDG
jgi:hypothetical protein